MCDSNQGDERVLGETTTCERVVMAVADSKGVDATSLPPLYETVDPACLNDIFDDTAAGVTRTGGVVSFRWADCHVVVEDEHVTVSVESPVTASSPGAARPTNPSEGRLD